MYSYGCNTTGTTCVNVNNVHNQLNPFTPSSSSMKPKINYYNNRRKDIKLLFSPTNVKQQHHTHIHKSTSVNSVDECSHKKKQIQVNNVNKEHLHSNSTKQIMNYEDNKIKKVNEVIHKDKEQMKSKQNDNKDDVYKKQLEEEIKKCKLHNESLLKEVERYKKQIQKLIEDNIKLKRINQEQSIIIHKSNAFSCNHNNKFTITNELTFTFTPIVKHTQFHMNNVKPISGTDELFNTLEQDNFALSEQLLTLESQIDLYMKSKSRMNDDYTLSSSNIHNNNNNNTDRSNIYNHSLNENEICSLLYAFYHKLSSLLNKPTIEFDMISYNKKAFILSTSSMLTEIQAYKAFLPKPSSHNNN